MITLAEFEKLTGVLRVSIIKWAKEYGFYLEKVQGKNSMKYMIDKNYVTIFKEIQILKKELKVLAVTEARRKRAIIEKNGNLKREKKEKFSIFKIGERYEVFKNDKKSPKRLGIFTREQLKTFNIDVDFREEVQNEV